MKHSNGPFTAAESNLLAARSTAGADWRDDALERVERVGVRARWEREGEGRPELDAGW